MSLIARCQEEIFLEAAILRVTIDLWQENDMKTYKQFPARYYSMVHSNPGSILLQTARFDAENYRSYLFTRPLRMLTTSSGLFEEIDAALACGNYVAGFYSYECGESLRNLGNCNQTNMSIPRGWFGVYSKAYIFNHLTGEFEGEAPDDFLAEEPDNHFEIQNLHFGLNENIYAEKIAVIQEYIRAGDTYQVNFTDRVRFEFTGSAMAMFAKLVESQPVAYSAFLHGEKWQILSFSPELFFRQNNRKILTRPMKGTAPRGSTLAEDKKIARWLENDTKNRSENVMIVDLMRNDLGRICEFGSVRVDELFHVEKYETLFQMTSEVSGTLRPEMRYGEIFASLFPCGSVTGAPKHRTMEIIQELEQSPRGVYTGAIGFFSPAQEAVFSVPIRTVVLENNCGMMGVGGGIVIDSQAKDEFHECQLKYEFLTRREEPFELLESILWNDDYSFLSLHLERMESSATYFGFNFERNSILEELKVTEKQFACGVRRKVRVLLERSGAVKVTHTAVGEQAGTGKVALSKVRVSSADRFLRHKTTRRQLYDQQYEQAVREGYDEVLFLNECNELTEGAISNLFIEKEGQWLTPRVECGLLPGVYRRHLLETKPGAEERRLQLEDLASADAIYICNAVRGCRRVMVETFLSAGTGT
jgi:para-aminobenzoate synthetase/4-amino-4-deoxychorismate lyase